MSEPESVLYRNWMKAGMAFLHTKRGLQGFIEGFIDNYATDLYTKVIQQLGHAPGTTCTSCSIYNILKCPTKGICSGKYCSFHDVRDPRKVHKQCPLGICNKIRDALVAVHKHKGPSFRNTAAEDWCNSSWEVAKCFLQMSGYVDVRSADDTDLPGLLSIVLNHVLFIPEFTENITASNNILIQARDIRNKVMHDAKMEVYSKDLAVYLNVLIKLLSDSKRLQHLPEAQESIRKLNELQNDIFTIGKADEERLMEESRKAIKEVTEEAKEMLENQRGHIINDIEKAATTALTEAVTALTDKQTDIIDGIEDANLQVTESIREYKNIKANMQKLQMLQLDEKSYGECKKELRNVIIRQYEDNFCTMPFSPLIQEEEVGVDKLFVMPTLRVVNHDLPRSYNGSLRYRYIKNFREILTKDSRKARRVYLLSDAGRGKTTLCQMMIKKWCEAHSSDDDSEFDDDKTFLKTFEFLFYLPLRSMTHLYHTTDMIKELLVRAKFHAVLDRVLGDESDKCLLILDGLDEWTPPDIDGSLSDKQKRVLPFIDHREEFTILTTSRPWKLELLRLKSSKIDLEVELRGTSEGTAETLVSKLVALLNHKFGKTKKSSTIIKELQDKNLVHFTNIPFILMQVVCLWHDGKEYGNTQVEVYNNMVNFLLELAQERLDEEEGVPKETTDTIFGDIAKLAFKTLFRENKESMIIFPRSVTKPFDIPKDNISFCLKVGLLSQSKHMAFAASRMKSLSFVHKTFHEFFAAKFIAADDESVDDLFGKLNDMSTVFEMERVLVFLSGLKPGIINRIILHIAETTDNDDGFREYRHSVSYRRYYNLEENVLNLQNLVIECMTEGFKDDFSKVDVVLRDITTIEFYNKFTEQHMARVRLDGVRSVVVDHTEIPFVLTPILGNNVDTITKLAGYVSSQDQIDMLRSVMGRTQDSIRSLSICSSRYAKPDLKEGLHLGDLFQSVDKMAHLGCIEFERVDLTHARIEELMGFLKSKTLLRQIVLCDITCTSCKREECSYDIDFSAHSQLELMSLTSLYVNDIHLNTEKLQSCHMSSLQRPNSVTSILRGVKNSGLRSLIFSKSIAVSSHKKYADSVDALTDVIPTLKHLEYLSLKGVMVGQDKLVLSKEMTNMEYIALICLIIDPESLKTFTESLPSAKQDFEILLNEVYIDPAGSIPNAVKYLTENDKLQIMSNVPTESSNISFRLRQIQP